MGGTYSKKVGWYLKENIPTDNIGLNLIKKYVTDQVQRSQKVEYNFFVTLGFIVLSTYDFISLPFYYDSCIFQKKVYGQKMCYENYLSVWKVSKTFVFF